MASISVQGNSVMCDYSGGAGEEAGDHHQVQAALQTAVGARPERAGQAQTGTLIPHDCDTQ